MIYRRAGISFTRYQDERRLWKLPTDRWAVIVIFALLLVAPFLVDRLFVVGYLLPLIIWSMAAMGLNLLMGGAGQIHLGYGAVIGIGAYASVHAMRAGLPFELAMIIGGLASAAIGVVFGAAALRVRGCIWRWRRWRCSISSISSSCRCRRSPAAPRRRCRCRAPAFWASPSRATAPLLCGAGAVCGADPVHAERAAHLVRAGAGGGTGKGLCGLDHRGGPVPLQAAGVLGVVVHRRHDRGGAGGLLLSHHLARPVPSGPVDPAGRHGDRGGLGSVLGGFLGWG